MKLYIGNLPWKIDNNGLKELFSEFGTVEDAIVITDKFTRRSKGFGFVTFTSDEDGKKAITEMHEKEFEGRALTVSEARPMKNESSSRDESSFESRDAPMANSSHINDAVEDSIGDHDMEPEIADDNSDAEPGEHDIKTANEAIADSSKDKLATSDAPKATETTEAEDDESEDSKPEGYSEDNIFGDEDEEYSED